MKRTFDTAGVNSLQEQVLSASNADRFMLIHSLMSDFVAFMLTHFDLQPSQVQYLHNMSTALKTNLSIGIADSWNNGLAVNFQKDSTSAQQRAEKKKDPPKDIILSRYNSSSDQPVVNTLLPTGYYSIRIVYRDTADS